MSAKQTNNQVKRKLFISHSHRDDDLADAFKALITDGTELSCKQIYMSSNRWTSTRYGSDERPKLMEALVHARIHVALITPNYLRSETCNAELGYIWASQSMGRPSFPFKFKLPRNHVLPWYMQDIKSCRLAYEEDLDDLRDVIVDTFHVKQPTSAWNRARRQFLKKVDKLVADIPIGIDYLSMGRFLDACELQNRVLFFNVQVTFQDWFRSELQTHLALQDAACTYYQLQHLIDTTGGAASTIERPTLPVNFGTPSARVLFVPETWDELAQQLTTDHPRCRSFVDLVLIHLFMSMPLALVTVDQLADLMLLPGRSDPEQLDFYDDSLDYERVLNLPRMMGNTDRECLQKELKQSLKSMRMLPDDDPPSIDFALLIEANRSRVWRGRIRSQGARYLEYVEVGRKRHRETFSRFGRTVDSAVFQSFSHHDNLGEWLLHIALPAPDDQLQEEIHYFHELIATRNPIYKVFHENGTRPRIRKKFCDTMKFVKPLYCPLRLIERAGRNDIFQLIPRRSKS